MLQLSSNNINIGTVQVGVPHKFSVGLLNTGIDKSTIIQLQPCCGSCTTAVAENNEIAPGTIGTVKIIFTANSTSFSTTKCVNIHYTGADLVPQKIVFNFTAKVI